MTGTVKKIFNISSTVLLVIFILFVVLLTGVRLVGIEPHIVLSGSMEPEIMTGSLVYVVKATPEETQNLKVGETVTYVVDSNGTKVTHKIHEVVGPIYEYEELTDENGQIIYDNYGKPYHKVDDNGNPVVKKDENGNPVVKKDNNGNPIVMYVTKGTANNSPDGTTEKPNLASSNVYGKPIFSIPFLGYVAHFVQNPPGKYVALIACILLVAMTMFSSTGASGDKKNKKAADEPAAEGEGEASEELAGSERSCTQEDGSSDQ